MKHFSEDSWPDNTTGTKVVKYEGRTSQMKITKRHIAEIATLLAIFTFLALAAIVYIAIDRIEWTPETFKNLEHTATGLILVMWPLSVYIAYKKGWRDRGGVKRLRITEAMTYQKEPHGFRYLKK
jgi:NhaP-type Na+/H+ or K+/H+ antiporter